MLSIVILPHCGTAALPVPRSQMHPGQNKRLATRFRKMSYWYMPSVKTKHSSGEEAPLEDRLSEHQIKGWNAVSAAAAGWSWPKLGQKESVFHRHTHVYIYIYIYIYTERYTYIYIYIRHRWFKPLFETRKLFVLFKPLS